MKERIKEYLANGLKPAQVATVVGCSPAYISQLLKDQDFLASVEALKISSNASGDTILDTRYEAAEHQIVNEIVNRLGEAEFAHLPKALDSIVRARDVRHKQRNPAFRTDLPSVTVVPIMIPQHALSAPALRLNEKSEVVAIDNTPLAPMSAEGVKNLFSKLPAAQNQLEKPNDPFHALVSAVKKESATPVDF